MGKLEMDDAVIGYAVTQANADFVFVQPWGEPDLGRLL